MRRSLLASLMALGLPLMSHARAEEATPAAAAAAAGTPTAVAKARLVGVILSSAQALLWDDERGEYAIYKVGEDLLGGRLVELGADHVVVDRGETREVVEISAPPQTKVAGRKMPRRMPAMIISAAPEVASDAQVAAKVATAQAAVDARVAAAAAAPAPAAPAAAAPVAAAPAVAVAPPAVAAPASAVPADATPAAAPLVAPPVEFDPTVPSLPAETPSPVAAPPTVMVVPPVAAPLPAPVVAVPAPALVTPTPAPALVAPTPAPALAAPTPAPAAAPPVAATPNAAAPAPAAAAPVVAPAPVAAAPVVAPAPVAAAPVAAAPRQTGGAIVIARADLDRELGDFNALTQQVQVTAERDGGFRLAQVRPGSFLERLGLRANDIVVRVDGRRINGLDDASAAYAWLRVTDKFTVELVRDGRPLTLRYKIG